MLKVATLLDLLHGAGVTVAVSMLAIAAGIPLGLMLAAGRTGRSRVVRAFCAAYSSFVRAVPVVTFMMLIYFGLPALGIALDPFPAAVFALALNTAAFNGQIWRSSLPSLVNEMTLLIKVSPAIAIIGVVDLTRKARQISAVTYEPLPAFVSAALIYGLVLALLVAGARWLERRLARRFGFA